MNNSSKKLEVWKSEQQLQSKLFIWFYNEFPQFRILSKSVKTPRSLLIHNYLNPKNKIDGAKLAASGLCKGFPDMTLHVSRRPYGALMIELKLPGEKPKSEQLEVHKALRAQGFHVVWCDSLAESKKEILKYLQLCKE